MDQFSYSRHRYPPVVIQHAIWLYLRFTLSYCDVEELLAERGLDVSYERVRSWVVKFGRLSRRVRRCRSRPSDRWHLDEMVVGSPASGCICGGRSTTRGEIRDVLVQRRRD